MRQRALKALRSGRSRDEVNEMFGLGIHTLRTWEKLEAETGSLEDRPSKRTAYKIDREKLLKFYEENPYSTSAEAAVAFNCSDSGIKHARKAVKITRKKTQFCTRNETK
jgi:transposase